VIARVVTWASTLAALVLLASFGLFAVDQARDGSKQQVARLDSEIGPGVPQQKASANVNQADPSPRAERIREKRHGDVREAIDDADDVLVSPFANAVKSNDIWAQRGIPTLIALLLFGVGLRVLAGYLPGGARR
jgi:hypothetical protein